MKVFHFQASIVLLGFFLVKETAALSIPAPTTSALHRTTTTPTTTTTTALYATADITVIPSPSNEIRDPESSKILQASVVVGILTAVMGHLYGQVLSTCVTAVWTTLPNYLATTTMKLNPIYFITTTCTAGGLVTGLLSECFASFTVGDFVSDFSTTTKKTKSLPSARSALFPLLLLSLITSTCGFSVGPEAPMVCAGALLGGSVARRFYKKSHDDAETILAYAGAAGALTAFMGIPLAGSIFALELTRSSAAMSHHADAALSPTVVSSVAALVVIRALLVPSKAVGGHFAYGAIGGALSGRTMILAALGSSVAGAVIGTAFHKIVKVLKDVFWSTASSMSKQAATKDGSNNKWKRQVAVKTIVGLLVGLLSSYYPQTLFWGEGSLQCVIDGQQTAFSATKHGLSNLLTSAAKVNPSLPFNSASAALQVGFAKLIAIALACAGKFPGGIIFPLFFAAAPFAHAACASTAALPVVVMCLMASTQASVTRTPLATALILSLSASATTELSVMLPACLVASYMGVWISQLLSKNTYFQYSE